MPAFLRLPSSFNRQMKIEIKAQETGGGD